MNCLVLLSKTIDITITNLLKTCVCIAVKKIYLPCDGFNSQHTYVHIHHMTSFHGIFIYFPN